MCFQNNLVQNGLGYSEVPQLGNFYPNEAEDVKSGRVTPEQYIEYLLIAENVERRGQAETDPMKKARIGEFLREYWRLKGEYLEGRPKKGKHNAHTFSDIADAITVAEAGEIKQ